MPPACRVGDNAHCPADVHGKSCCVPHVVTGPATVGSPDVLVNGKPLLRVGDTGTHAACCGSNTWTSTTGSPTVLVNNKPCVRLGDVTTHCGGVGSMIIGSPDVLVG